MDDAIAFAVQRFTVEALKKEQENAIRAFYREKTFLRQSLFASLSRRRLLR